VEFPNLDSLESSGRSTIALILEQIESLKQCTNASLRERARAIISDG
jgi:hypothetical protein